MEKDKFIHMNANDPHTQSMDSGDPKTLVSCCKWAISKYPAKHYALIFWNHGSGILDTDRGRILNVIDLFVFNPKTRKFDLDRSISPFELLQDRGVCWDDTTGNYLTNQKLDSALKMVCENYLHGEKFNIIGFDACFMSMLEVANIIKHHSHIMVGSQEVELGTGWNYSKVLAPFTQGSMDPVGLATQMVVSYHDVYEKITNDFTQSAINLDALNIIEEDINTIASLLIYGLKNQNQSSVKNVIERSRRKSDCTHFSEPSYIDLHHWYNNLLSHSESMSLHNTHATFKFKEELQESLKLAIANIENTVFANAAGHSLIKAEGLSVYFPLRNIHSSYKKTQFAQGNAWPTFLDNYLKDKDDLTILQEIAKRLHYAS